MNDEVTASTTEPDGFDEGWDAPTPTVEEGTPEPPAEDQPQETPAETQGAPAEDQPQEVPAAETQQAPTWTITQDGQQRTLTAQEITPDLLTKGLAYDQLKTQADQDRPVLELFRDFAQKAGMTLPDYVNHLRTEAAKANGMTEEQAKQSIALEDRERAIQAQEAARKAQETERKQRDQRAKGDVAMFARAFPDAFQAARADPKTIPDAVWAEVKAGIPLAVAYAKHLASTAQATAQAQAQVKAQETANANRSTGSMKTAGAKKTNDPFLEGWGD